MDLDEKPRIDAKTFQEPLWKLAEAMAQLVRREGMNYLPGPAFIAEDIQMMIRQAIATYNLLFYLNADERRALCANIAETSCVTAISEQGGKENQYGNDERFCSARYRCDGSI